MPLDASRMVANGPLIHEDIRQFVLLLTGSMSDQPVVINNTLGVRNFIEQPAISTHASNPPVGSLRLYPKSDGNYYKLDSAGVEMPLGTGGTGGGGGLGGGHAEFLPANGTNTINMAAAPSLILAVSRGGVVQSQTDGNYSVLGATLTFSDPFDGTERVVVTFADGPAATGVLTNPLSQDLLFQPDNYWSIGTWGDQRPTAVYVGGTVYTPYLYVSGYQTFIKQTTPPSAPTGGIGGDLNLYVKSDDKLYYMGTNGVEVAVGGASFPLLAPNGLQTAPSYSFSASPAAGMWSPGANLINLIGSAGVNIYAASGTVRFGRNAVTSWMVNSSNHLQPADTNLYDIGVAGAYPRTVYAATSFIGPGALPTGGASGQVLAKTSASDYAVAWITPAGGVSFPLYAPDGSASAPQYAFNNSQTTGLFRAGSDSIGFATNGQQRWQIEADGSLVASADYTIGHFWGAGRPSEVNVGKTVKIGGYSGQTSSLNIERASGAEMSQLGMSTNFSARWAWYMDGAEPGSNAGGNLTLSRYDDTGGNIGAPITITRSSGLILFGSDITGTSGFLNVRNGTTGQMVQIFNTYTNASNYEVGVFGWSANALYIGTQNAGTGVAREIRVQTGSTNRWQFTTTGHFQAFADNTYDIGQSGANRPRNLYVAGQSTFTGNVGIAASPQAQWNLYMNGGAHYGGICVIDNFVGYSNVSENMFIAAGRTSGGAAQSVILAHMEAPSTASTWATVIETKMQTQNAAFTISWLIGLRVNSPTIQGSSVATNTAGLYLHNMGSAGVTNAYGIYINAPTGAVTTNIGLRNEGTTQLTGNVGIAVGPQTNVRTLIRGVDATSSNMAFQVQSSTPADLFLVRNDGWVQIAPAAGRLNFFGASNAPTKLTVSGAKSSNAALGSLLTALA